MSFLNLFCGGKSLRRRVEALEKIIAEEITKKTVSKTTTQEETPLTPKQILNEWFNGKEDN